MKKTIAIIFTILSFIFILDSLNFGHALMMFLLAGVIPGTDISISAGRMMEFFGLLIGLVIGRLSTRPLQALFTRLPQLKRA